MIHLVRTDSTNPHFIELVKRLDADLAQRDVEELPSHAQSATTDKINYVVVAYEDEQPIGCGAVKEYAPGIMEVKRMYTSPESRGKGVATKVLNELEAWAAELTYKLCILETTKKQPEAIRLYQKSGYKIIPNYGQYVNVEDSLCFEKSIVS